MSVRLSDDEAWAVLDASHTGILSSLRRDGVPVTLPVWFITDGRTVLVAGPKASHKFARMGRDPRVSFLVESGRSWRDLRAVHLVGRADILGNPDWESLDRHFDEKYRGFRTPRAEMPASARERYDSGRSLVRIVATEPLITWDNERLESR
jgi:nitroimidazol reductase NimA-like FMN-containing flavoprotein (pyridoxamine 5'-phosphate oxidase superfamily)